MNEPFSDHGTIKNLVSVLYDVEDFDSSDFSYTDGDFLINYEGYFYKIKAEQIRYRVPVGGLEIKYRLSHDCVLTIRKESISTNVGEQFKASDISKLLEFNTIVLDASRGYVDAEIVDFKYKIGCQEITKKQLLQIQKLLEYAK